jgi:hypothetical protein
MRVLCRGTLVAAKINDNSVDKAAAERCNAMRTTDGEKDYGEQCRYRQYDDGKEANRQCRREVR